MKHLGDITKIHGWDIEPVDCITGGSPCQDLSVAGKRAGLSGERSGLFMEQIRIVKEMREHDRQSGRPDELLRPRFMVWENVPGAFSSNKGADFQAVLTEIVRIAEPEAPDVPMPDGGRWTKAGCLYGELGRWSIAWRLHDAQFWGVPQRRKRIALVADFGGLSAPEILFERKGLSGDSEPCGEAGQETAGAAGGGVEGAEPILLESNQNHATVQTDGISTALPASMGMGGGYVPMVTAYGISSYDSNAMKSPNPHSGIYEADTARTLDLNGGSPACNQGGIAVVQPSYCLQGNGIGRSDNAGCDGKGWTEEVSYTLNTIDRPAVVQSVGCDVYNQEIMGEVAASLTAASGGTNTSGPKVLCLNDQGGSVMGVSEDVTGALRAEEHGHQPIVYNGENITSPLNKADPQPGDPCHTLGTDSRNYLVYENHSQDSRNNPMGEICETVSAKYGTGGNNQPLVVDCETLCMDVGFFNTHRDVAGSLLARQYKDPPIVDAPISGIVRRLTPLECERLQGYPDGWTDIGEWTDSKGKRHKDADSPRYKALGNSIALPFWFWLLRRISAQYERPATLGSLFDGIGGFPLCWERCNGKGTARWASEIEEFPIAVTKLRFPEESNK